MATVTRSWEPVNEAVESHSRHYEHIYFRLTSLATLLESIRRRSASGQLIINLNNGSPAGFAELILERKPSDT